MDYQISYFSGTGCTAMTAEHLARVLDERGLSGNVTAIMDTSASGAAPHKLLFLLFPIYACHAPGAVYKWIRGLSPVSDIPAAVISVSGGGEISPNTAGRRRAIKMLEKKGYQVFYEQMIVMPSNCFTATAEPMAIKLLQVLPRKIERIVSEVLSCARRRTSPLIIDRFLSLLGEMEKPFARSFGKRISADNNCIGCGFCAAHCPAGNIMLAAGKPMFANKCHLCLKCIYSCPKQALMPSVGKAIILKQGFNLRELAEKAALNEQVSMDGLAQGYLWSGLRKYLAED